MTKDIEETRELNNKKAQVEAAVEILKTAMAKQEVHIGVSALMSYMTMLAYHNGYPVDKLIAYITTLYELFEKNKQ
jgi:hypothetical protein